MKIIIDKTDLQNILKKAISATEKKSALPILSNFLLKAEDNKLIIEATDLETHIRLSVFTQVEEEGSACVNAKRLTDISRLLPTDKVNISLEGNTLKIKSGKTKYSLPTANVEDFPQMKEFPEDLSFIISGDEIQNAIRKTLYCVSKEESRYAIQGVLLKSRDDKIDFVATDGHRLALYTVEKTGNIENPVEAIIPQKALNELRKLLTGMEDVKIAVEEQYIFFKTPEWILMSRLLEGAFPDYTKVFPSEFTAEILLDKKQLIDAVKRVSAVIEGDTKPVKFILNDNKLTLRSFSQEYGEAVDEIDIDYQGDEFVIGFNAKYVIDAVEPIDEEKFYMKFTNPKGQTVVQPVENEKYKAIIMPMDID